MSGDSGVTISPKEIYEKVLGMEQNLSDIKGLLEKTIVVMEQRHGRTEERVDLHDEQISTLRAQNESHAHSIALLEADRKRQEKRDTRRPTWWGIIAAGGGLVALMGVIQQTLNAVLTGP